MDKVKAALTDFTSRSGHHDTTVHEAVAPAVTHETVKPHQHEEINTAVDKEVHQDHYHHTVQPIQDREVLPETHTAKLGGVQHREFDNRDHDSVKRTLAEQQAQFKNERVVEGHTSSRSVAPTIGGEHVHHHIHETIQPVVQKEVIQPNVVHTTVPIHEVHHNKATHHGTTALPAMTMDEFKHKGGALSGREERYDEFEGVPKNIGGGSTGGFGHHRDGQSTGHHTGSEAHRHGDFKDAPNHSGGLTGSTHNTHGTHGTSNVAGVGAGSGLGSEGRHVGTDGAIGKSHTKAELGSGTHDSDLPKALTEDKSRFNPSTGHGSSTGHHDKNTSSTTHGKPSLLDKLNPMKDSDHDGKKGMMD